jgi:hypothetical protein
MRKTLVINKQLHYIGTVYRHIQYLLSVWEYVFMTVIEKQFQCILFNTTEQKCIILLLSDQWESWCVPSIDLHWNCLLIGFLLNGCFLRKLVVIKEFNKVKKLFSLIIVCSLKYNVCRILISCKSLAKLLSISGLLKYSYVTWTITRTLKNKFYFDCHLALNYFSSTVSFSHSSLCSGCTCTFEYPENYI